LNKKILKYIEHSAVVMAFVILFFGIVNSSFSSNKVFANNSFGNNCLINKELRKKDSIINFYESTLNSNKRLLQHFYAVIYSDSAINKANIITFLKISGFKNVNEAFATALLETDNGKTGIGPLHNNHFGMKQSTTRFSWSIGAEKSGYAKYESWTFSYLDFFEYTQKGYKNWQKNAKNLKLNI
jgi:hypothetical protein